MGFLQKLKSRAQFLIRDDRGSTMEDNTNRSAWWIAAIIIFAIVAGLLWYIVGSLANQAQTGAQNLSTNMSTQGGLNKMATAAQTAGTATTGGASGGTAMASGSYTAP